jgi:hypothetical protein
MRLTLSDFSSIRVRRRQIAAIWEESGMTALALHDGREYRVYDSLVHVQRLKSGTRLSSKPESGWQEERADDPRRKAARNEVQDGSA